MAHMGTVLAWVICMECINYDSKRAHARARPRFTSSEDTETLCVNGSKRGYRGFCTRVRSLNAYV